MWPTSPLVAAACLLAFPIASQAVVVPSVYNDEIFAYFPLDGNPDTDPDVGTAFDDWDEIPVAFTDPEDNPGFADFKTIKLANDENYLYVYAEYFGEPSKDTYVSIDTDQDLGTGFDIFSFGLVGADVSWVNDFPFSQRDGGFNDGPLFGGPFSNGGAPIFPFFNLDGPEREWMIPLDVTYDAEGAEPVFAQDTIDILLWNEAGQSDLLGTFPEFATLTYTLASPPVLEGDYNDDGMVDTADYTVWRDSVNDIGIDLPADGNGDQVVDGDDYDIWSANYGSGSSLAATSVPEPASAISVIVLGLAAATRLRGVNLRNHVTT